MFACFGTNLIIAVTLAVAYQGGQVRNYPIAPDHSLTPAIYIQRGLPANDRPWVGADYRQTASVLKTLMETDPTLLPRYKSPSSGAMFARIVSPENFGRFRNEAFSRQTRIAEASDILGGVSRILLVYNSATDQTRVFDSEEVELSRFLLEISRDFMQLTDARNGLSGDMPAMDRQQMSQGLASIMSGCLRMLKEKNFFRPSELVRLADTEEVIFPQIFSYLPPGTQLELKVRLEGMIKAETDPMLKERLIRIAAALGTPKGG